jgi:transketolase
MRTAFFRALTDLAENNPSVVLLTGDLGYMVIDPFRERFPERFFNVGVAEQNLLGLATGLAESGFVPFVYSIAPFVVFRPYEFIRNGPVKHRLPVRIVGVGGGFDYANDGFSHYALEDVAVLRVQPGTTVVAPADSEQVTTALEATWNLPGPVYYRLGKDELPPIPNLSGRFALGRVETVREGSEVLLLAMGPIAAEALRAADLLAEEGIACTVAVVAAVSPPPTEDLERLLAAHRVAVTVEAHYVCGGLGSLVSEVIAASGCACRLTRCGVRSLPGAETGTQAFLRQQHGLDAESLATTVRQSLNR